MLKGTAATMPAAPSTNRPTSLTTQRRFSLHRTTYSGKNKEETPPRIHPPTISQGHPAVSNPAAESRPTIDPRLGLMVVCAHHLIDLFQGGPVDTNLARDMAQHAIDAYNPQSRADC